LFQAQQPPAKTSTSTTSTTTTATIVPVSSASSAGGEGDDPGSLPGATVGALTGPATSPPVPSSSVVPVVVPEASGPRHALASLRLAPVCVAQNSAALRLG
jgi:hypothetical protein